MTIHSHIWRLGANKVPETAANGPLNTRGRTQTTLLRAQRVPKVALKDPIRRHKNPDFADGILTVALPLEILLYWCDMAIWLCFAVVGGV